MIWLCPRHANILTSVAVDGAGDSLVTKPLWTRSSIHLKLSYIDTLFNSFKNIGKRQTALTDFKVLTSGISEALTLYLRILNSSNLSSGCRLVTSIIF